MREYVHAKSDDIRISIIDTNDANVNIDIG